MKRAFTLMEAMIVLAMVGVVVAVSTMTFVSLLNSAKRGRVALQAMGSTRTALDFLLEEARGAGGPDLPGSARVLIDKSGGANQTDVLWLIDQATGYGTCVVTGVSGSALQFPVVSISGVRRCCFEAGADPVGTPPLPEGVPAGAPFRRTAVIFDDLHRFVPVFLEGDPSAAGCTLTMKRLPGIDRVVNGARRNEPALVNATAVLADVKRVYVDFDADGVQAPFGALYAQVESDGDVDSFVGERQRLSSNVIDLRAGVGYGTETPNVAPPPDEDDDPAVSGDPDEIAAGATPLVELATNRRGWRNLPVPIVTGGEAAPQMLGIALTTGARGAGAPSSLPWSTRPVVAGSATGFSLVGRVTFRDGALP